MRDIDEILNDSSMSIDNKIGVLTSKAIKVPSWNMLKNEYNPKMHDVMNKAIYHDLIDNKGQIRHVTRVTYNLQKLAVKRMTELACGIPIKRAYHVENENQALIKKYIEKILTKNHIDNLNNQRFHAMFASCEMMTLWYSVREKNSIYGFDSEIKLRCRCFSPMDGDDLYPLFDEYGDMTALSVGYTQQEYGQTVTYLDSYTKSKHLKWVMYPDSTTDTNSGWHEVENEDITIGKIPGIYCWRPLPIWEDTTPLVNELEFTMSRDGNYLRKNLKPLFAICSDEIIEFGKENEDDNEDRSILQFPEGATANYVTWEGAIENLKFYIGELRQSFFTQLQLPDWSYESMKAVPMSGESRKQLFIDAQMKVKDESGRLQEFCEREINVIKAFLKTQLPEMSQDIDNLDVSVEISPFTINDERDRIDNLQAANGGRPLMSQRESIEYFGVSSNVDKTMAEIHQDDIRELSSAYNFGEEENVEDEIVL